MNVRCEHSFDARRLALAAFILGLGLLPISRCSLWRDDVSHAQYIVRGNLAATVRDALKFGKLGYLLIEYFWGALPGAHTGEFALRCCNLVFTLIAIHYALRIVERRNWPLWSCLLFFAHPMYIYYKCISIINEVTPYILLYALALGFTYHVFLSNDEFSQPRNIVAINALFLFGAFVHFIFGFVVLLYFARCFMSIRHQRGLVLRHARIMLAFGVGYLPMLYLILRYMDGTATGFSIVNPLSFPTSSAATTWCSCYRSTLPPPPSSIITMKAPLSSSTTPTPASNSFVRQRKRALGRCDVKRSSRK